MSIIFPTNMPEPTARYRAYFYDKAEHETFSMTFPGRLTYAQAEDRARRSESRTIEFSYVEAV